MGQNNNKYCSPREVVTIILLILLGVVCVSLFFVGEDNFDIDNTIGPYLCESHGLKFKYVDYKLKEFISYPKFEYLKIICYNETKEQNQIDDGYLILES